MSRYPTRPSSPSQQQHPPPSPPHRPTRQCIRANKVVRFTTVTILQYLNGGSNRIFFFAVASSLFSLCGFLVFHFPTDAAYSFFRNWISELDVISRREHSSNGFCVNFLFLYPGKSNCIGEMQPAPERFHVATRAPPTRGLKEGNGRASEGVTK